MRTAIHNIKVILVWAILPNIFAFVCIAAGTAHGKYLQQQIPVEQKVMAIQREVGVDDDGAWGRKTNKAYTRLRDIQSKGTQYINEVMRRFHERTSQ